MSGLGNALPRAEWLRWLQDVFDPHRKTVSETFKDHDERLSSAQAATVALGEALAAQGERLDKLEARVRALEDGDEPKPEPEPDPDPEPEPEPGPYLPPVLASTTLEGFAPPDPTLETDPPTGPVTKGHWYVDGNRAAPSGDGRSLATAFRTLEEGLAAVRDGQTLIVRQAIYQPAGTINRRTAWREGVRVLAYGHERPIIDGSKLASGARVIYFHDGSQREHWKGFEIRNAPGRGAHIEGQHITLEDVWIHHTLSDAFYATNLGSGTSDILYLDCMGWAVGDGRSTGTNTPDVFVATASKDRNIHRVRAVRCGAGNGADDGFDWFQCSDGSIESSGTAGAGRYWTGSRAGDGGGFKMGGGTNSGRNRLAGSIAAYCAQTGLNHNSAPNPNVLDGNTTVENRQGVIADNNGAGNLVQNNLAWKNARYDNSPGPQTERRNSWNIGVTDPRFANPNTGDYSLRPDSPALDAGVDGGTLGANDSAARITKWLINHPEVYVP